MDKLFKVIGAGFVLVALTAGIGLLLAFPIKWAWNATMPEIFDLIKITWGQAWCLNFLASSLIQSSLSHNKDS